MSVYVIQRYKLTQASKHTFFINVSIGNVNPNTTLISLFPLTTKHAVEISTLHQT